MREPIHPCLRMRLSTFYWSDVMRFAVICVSLIREMWGVWEWRLLRAYRSMIWLVRYLFAFAWRWAAPIVGRIASHRLDISTIYGGRKNQNWYEIYVKRSIHFCSRCQDHSAIKRKSPSVYVERQHRVILTVKNQGETAAMKVRPLRWWRWCWSESSFGHSISRRGRPGWRCNGHPPFHWARWESSIKRYERHDSH